MLDPFSIGVMLDPGTSLLGAKQFLQAHGFTHGFGSPEVMSKFKIFVDRQTEHGMYAGKPVTLGAGGRAAILKHKLIVSGKFGKTLDDISPEDWQQINKISKINFFKKYRLAK